MTTPATQAILPVTPEDRELVYGLLMPAARSVLQKLALEYIRDGKSDDADAVQQVARHRQARSLPGDVGTADFVRDDQCNVEFGTVPDCDCPHEHWHVGGICLDVHIEEDRTGHAILGNDDWQLEVSGVENLDEMRAIAFAWAKQKYALTPSVLSGDAGEIGLREALEDIARQRLTSEMDEDQAEHADYEGAYDIIVGIARAAIPSHQGAGE